MRPSILCASCLSKFSPLTCPCLIGPLSRFVTKPTFTSQDHYHITYLLSPTHFQWKIWSKALELVVFLSTDHFPLLRHVRCWLWMLGLSPPLLLALLLRIFPREFPSLLQMTNEIFSVNTTKHLHYDIMIFSFVWMSNIAGVNNFPYKFSWLKLNLAVRTLWNLKKCRTKFYCHLSQMKTKPQTNIFIQNLKISNYYYYLK